MAFGYLWPLASIQKSDKLNVNRIPIFPSIFPVSIKPIKANGILPWSKWLSVAITIDNSYSNLSTEIRKA
tara:strand:- start:9928 stop:10137 length:210 start_codon:yes stop_codon:yes gene_type:complete